MILFIGVFVLVVLLIVIYQKKYVSQYDSETAQKVKCLMQDGLYYESTKSANPLYDGEKPTLDVKNANSQEFKQLIKDIKVSGHNDWLEDLMAKTEK